MKILIIEDEKELRESICTFLSGEQYTCEKATDFNTALDKIHFHDYNCIILDINLPDGNGLEILKEIKKNNKADGVLIISARNALDDKVSALGLGADDYLTKPFHLSELAARVAAIIRRRNFDGKNIIYIDDDLQLNVNEKTVSVNNILLDLTRKEYDLLVYFISNKNKVITKNAIAEHLWGDGMEGAGSYDFIYAHIKNLRKKMISAGGQDYIKSIYGLGYKFNVI
ncbi:MAG: response regulator transcription factor [Bacteroidota bacterium]|nr:response regulator transcription factor [Bacteroidota bacterium]